MSLWDTIHGQAGAVTYLRQAIRKERVVSAYLFAGPEGAGKTLTASVFARALNCQPAPGEGCGSCPDCREIAGGSHPDVHFLSPASKSRRIVIDQLRDLLRLVHLQTRRDSWKVCVIEEADRMNESAQNAFLKTLEEPPERTVLILVTPQPGELFPTIRSRCQRVSFVPWTFGMMRPFLSEKTGLSEDESRVLHRISGGCPGRALRLFRGGILETRKKVVGPLVEGRFASAREVIARAEAWLDYLAERSRALREELDGRRAEWGEALGPPQLKALEEQDNAAVAAGERAELDLIFELIFSWIRDLFVCRSAGGEAPLINGDLADRIAAASRRRTPAQLRRMLEWVGKSRDWAVKAGGRAARQLILENMLIQLGYWQPR
ncbi:MAG: DNA polymerase III subunit delta' [PVC group bacterium]